MAVCEYEGKGNTMEMSKEDMDRFTSPAMQELGRRVFAAVLSYQMGNALQTEYKKIKDGEYGPISPAWAAMGWEVLLIMTGGKTKDGRGA